MDNLAATGSKPPSERQDPDADLHEHALRWNSREDRIRELRRAICCSTGSVALLDAFIAGKLRLGARHIEPSSRARLDKFSAAKPRLKPKGHP